MEEAHMSRESLASFKNLLTSIVFIWNHSVAVVPKLYLLSSFLPQPLLCVVVFSRSRESLWKEEAKHFEKTWVHIKISFYELISGKRKKKTPQTPVTVKQKD